SGFDIKTAFSVKEALNKIKKESFDLILLDIKLPEEDGTIFLEKAKDIIKINSIPIIAFSNYDTQEIKNKARQLGADKYIIKSNYTPSEVIKLIENKLK
ncbi:MAG: response regulator, partial [Minisyncoccales bacterium]